jgi:hypothetical protein
MPRRTAPAQRSISQQKARRTLGKAAVKTNRVFGGHLEEWTS